jgi:predicted nucleotidyltransferase component of viral defense system
MALSPTFSNQVRLLVATLPQVYKEDCFALKGGTAINLFIRDMPRLSVDIDLTYLPLETRETSLERIDTALKRIGNNIERYIPGTKVTANKMHKSPSCNRILVVGDSALIKIEVTPVLRGCVHSPVTMPLASSVEDMFGAAKMRLLNFEDIYGGKICAALDRQHPRDLFDIKYLLDNEGLTDELKNSFLVYLMSHNRPMAELLDPSPKDVTDLYEREFVGMTNEEIAIEKLYEARDGLLYRIHELLDEKDKEFLLSMKSGEPNWNLFNYPEAANLPAIQWKLYNITHMPSKKKEQALSKLEKALTGGPTCIFGKPAYLA